MGANSRMNQGHLTAEQISDLLSGNALAAVGSHLDNCKQCSREAYEISSAIANFERQSRLWAERRSAAMPFAAPEPRNPLLRLNTPYSWAGAILMLFCAFQWANSLDGRRMHPAESHVIAGKSTPKVAPAVLQSDDQLLGTIDGELRAEGAPGAGFYGLNDDSRGRHRIARKAVDE